MFWIFCYFIWSSSLDLIELNHLIWLHRYAWSLHLWSYFAITLRPWDAVSNALNRIDLCFVPHLIRFRVHIKCPISHHSFEKSKPLPILLFSPNELSTFFFLPSFYSTSYTFGTRIDQFSSSDLIRFDFHCHSKMITRW